MHHRAQSCIVVILLWMAIRTSLAGGMAEDRPDEPAPQVAEQATSGAAGHDRMLALLRQLAEQRDSLPGLGIVETEALRTELAELGSNASMMKQISLHFGIGIGAVNQGDVESGIVHLQKARELAPRRGGFGAAITLQLGVAYLRLGETENCIHGHSPDRCILPIRGGGVHSLEAGSRGAIPYFEELLADRRTSAEIQNTARWLLNLAHMTLGTYPDGVPAEYRIPPGAFESDTGFPRFINEASRLGLDTFSLAGGALIDDFDGDGYLDLVTTSWDPAAQMQMFRSDRKGGFSNVTEQAGLRGLYGGLNLIQADYDNDGDLDILVLRGAWLLGAGRMPNSLLRNNGDGSFLDVTFEAGLGEGHHPTQTAAWADYDNDGDLDLFVGNEGITKVDFEGNAISPEALGSCQLFRNNGDGTFTDVAARAGVAYLGYPKGVAWGDYDGDRFPDLYISEYSGPNVLYHNNGDGTFTDRAVALGVAGPLISFPTWFWDFDNDGALDLFVSSYSGRLRHVAAHYAGLRTGYEIAGHYRGDGHGGFEQMTREHGLDYPMLTMGANFGDLNGDGYLDMYLGTGDPSPGTLIPNVMFLNKEGKGFADVTMAGGFGHLQKGHGIAFADLDHDGDDDVFSQMGGFFPGDRFSDALYENPGFGAHWIAIQLVGVESNRSAIGARIRVRIDENGKKRSIYRHVNSGGSFGANPLRQTIGVAGATTIEELEVYWPTTGETQRFRDVGTDRTIRITEGRSRYEVLKLSRLRLTPGSPDAQGHDGR